jgi:hypothetical protein
MSSIERGLARPDRIEEHVDHNAAVAADFNVGGGSS